MWATEQEALEEWRSRYLTTEELEAKLEEEWLYEQQRYEIEAENAYVRYLERGDHLIGEPDWAM